MKFLIQSRPTQTRIAQIKGNKILGLHVKSLHKESLIGSIFVGKVSKIFKELGGGFIDVGLQKEVYLKLEENTENLQENQKVLVQIIKDPVGGKSARVSLSLSITGRRLIYLPQNEGVRISKKIESEKERERLIQKIEMLEPKGGIIVRTVCEGQNDFESDLKELYCIFEKIKKDKRTTPGMVLKGLDLELQILRDELNSAYNEIVVDDKTVYENITKYVSRSVPNWSGRITYYTKLEPLFEKYGIENKWPLILNKKVSLLGGGSIVIDETEALVSIDVNTSKSSPHLKNLAFNTNIEAAKEIAFQIRLRNCSGIIVIDFIDMKEESLREKLLSVFQKELKKDRMYTEIGSFSDLNLLQMTRKRAGSSFKNWVSQSCPYCLGRGSLLSHHFIAYEIFKDIESRYSKKYKRAYPIEVSAHKSVVEWILEKEIKVLEWFKEKYNLVLSFKEDQGSALEDFKVKADLDH